LKEVAAVAHGKEEERKWIEEMQMGTVLRNRCCENQVKMGLLLGTNGSGV